ncbi:MAG TPA: prolipoprotein diacylglyceryl transferase family protein [Microlunatus sp.]|nr:prolipoprotein diacylglyceryl transferase family protein [Microlunatus sp.]
MTHATEVTPLPTPRPRPRIALPGPWFLIHGRRFSWFHACGTAAALTWIVVLILGAGTWQLPVAALLIISATAVGTFVLLVIAAALLLGEGRLTWFHHHLAVLLTTGIAALTAQWPVLACLDAVGTGLLAFGTFGRLGCLLVGCCHGRPARGGVVYGPAHADAGFPPALVGVPLRPVQATESVVVAVLTAACLWVATVAPAGAAFGLSLAGYALARFWLETWRGDRRPHAAGLSEAQWTATGVAAVVVLASLTGASWVPPIVAALAATVMLSAVAQRLRPRRRRP